MLSVVWRPPVQVQEAHNNQEDCKKDQAKGVRLTRLCICTGGDNYGTPAKVQSDVTSIDARTSAVSAAS